MIKTKIKIRFGLQLDMVNVSQIEGQYRQITNTKKAAYAAFCN